MQLEQPPPHTHSAECTKPGPVFERELAFLTVTVGETQYSSFPLQFLICLYLRVMSATWTPILCK